MARKKRNNKHLFLLLASILAGYLLLLIFQKKHSNHNTSNLKNNSLGDLSRTERNAIERTIINYGSSIDFYANDLKLNPAYFKSLIVLECSGKKEIPPRFERRVFEQLKNVRDGKQKHYYNIKKKHIADASDDALKNLATSWGPFQVMGYQVLRMDINIKDLRGPKSIYWGIKWINERYGRKIKKEKYHDAFHIHNTGSPYPKYGRPRTHNPHYVPNGIKYMQYFQ